LVIAAVELAGHELCVNVALVQRHGVPIRGRPRLDDGTLEEPAALGHDKVGCHRPSTCIGVKVVTCDRFRRCDKL
jgi:hypothetical protein